MHGLDEERRDDGVDIVCDKLQYYPVRDKGSGTRRYGLIICYTGCLCADRETQISRRC